MPGPLGRAADRWHGLSSADRFRLYTRLVLQVVLVTFVIMMAVSGASTVPVVGIVVAGLAAIAGIEAQPDLAIRATERQRRIAWRFAVAGLAAVWLAAVIAVQLGPLPHVSLADGRVLASVAYAMATCAVLPFLRRRWGLLILAAAVTALLLRPENAPAFFALLVAVGVALMWTSRTTVWSLQILTELEDGKRLAAELEVAEERLRFSRDLHDVVGRAFSAVAVKSELAATLARAGAADRAAAEMDEVKTLAVTSLEDARALVRGYRNISLATEVAGAKSLLSAAGCGMRVVGDPQDVPTSLHEAAAWVVREGTTNIVKHSAATQAVLTLGPSGLVLTNDGALPPSRAGGAPSGLEGLRARLRAVGADLGTSRDGDEFTLTVEWGRA
ncbi:sensor histidine kinase [Tsukamurella sp. PLM1]|uniref:sensor histidine kinase n=1 Tax=Tsukamurella sp. PLM1 TaxID=2929795 RepID=UPI00205FE3FD|nr:histidine kinase [Tsukamurella sp. PLM1]BDH59051.1 sensor histidine kinase [Tsukamurella sp. PLM1]